MTTLAHKRLEGIWVILTLYLLEVGHAFMKLDPMVDLMVDLRVDLMVDLMVEPWFSALALVVSLV